MPRREQGYSYSLQRKPPDTYVTCEYGQVLHRTMASKNVVSPQWSCALHFEFKDVQTSEGNDFFHGPSLVVTVKSNDPSDPSQVCLKMCLHSCNCNVHFPQSATHPTEDTLFCALSSDAHRMRDLVRSPTGWTSRSWHRHHSATCHGSCAGRRRGMVETCEYFVLCSFALVPDRYCTQSPVLH